MTVGAVPESVARVLDAALAEVPDAEAVVGRSARLTYRELDAAADRAATALRALGLRPGDRVVASLPNDVDIVVAFHGAMRLGATWVGLNRNLAVPEKDFILDDSGSTLVLADAAVEAELRSSARCATDRQVVVVEPGDIALGRQRFAAPSHEGLDAASSSDPMTAPAVFAYTSGTTGRPKAAVHTQHNLLVPGAVLVSERGYGPDLRKGDCLPLTIPNLIVLTTLLTAQARGTCVVMDRLDAPGIAAWIRDERVTTWNGVPAILRALALDDSVSADDLGSLSEVWTGGDSCPESIQRAFADKFGLEPRSTYGLTEAPTIVSMQPVSRTGGRAGSSGRPLPHLDVTIRHDDRVLAVGAVGEVCVAAARHGVWAGTYTPMLRYHGHPEATRTTLRGGVLHTGDVGALDDDGNLTILARRTAVIIRGGANVYPAEVERVILEVPGVAAAAVIGVPDERLGQRVAAVVEASEHAGDGTDLVRDAVLLACRSSLARYKVPDQVTILDHLPRNAMGKVARSELVGLLPRPDGEGSGSGAPTYTRRVSTR